MERITGLLPNIQTDERSRPSEHETQSLEKKNYSESERKNASRHPDERYKAVIMRIVRKAYELASQPPLGNLETIADTWAEMLWQNVPEDKLWDMFNRACKDHQSNFPLAAYEINQAWDNVQKDDARKPDTAGADEWMGRLGPQWQPCDVCFDTGFVYTSKTFDNGRSYTGVVKSYCCNYWDKRREYLEKRK